MGRANRQHWTETHPDRPLWSPGRLAQARTQTQEEYEALYGRGQAPGAYSPLWGQLSGQDLQALREGFSDASDRIHFLTRMTGASSRDALQKDLVLAALWQGEWRQLLAESEQFEKHWAEVALPQENNLRSLWLERIVPGFLDNSGQRLEALEPDTARRVIESRPHGILGTAMEAGLPGNLLADYLARMQEESADLAADYFERQLRPEMDYLVRRDWGQPSPRAPSEKLARQLWHFLPGATGLGADRDPDKILQQLQKIWGAAPEKPLLPDLALSAQIYPETDPGIYREFFALADHWSGRPLHTIRDHLEDAGDQLLAEMLKSFYRGNRSQAELEAAWQETKLLGTPENPLQCLAPLYKDDPMVFEDLLQRARAQQKEGLFPDLDRAIDSSVSVANLYSGSLPRDLAHEIERSWRG